VASILEKIVLTKKAELDAARRKIPESELVRRLNSAPPVRDFYAALDAPGPIKLIAEVKKASPSKGVIRADFDPVAIARTYESHGAACVSVLTDEPYFQGSLRYLESIRAATTVPLLRKDFIIDRYQLLEARVAGADAVLLIAECLDDCLLRGLHNQVLELGMTPLVEFYEPDNLPRVLAAGATLIGVNNRDLRSFEIDLQHTIRMRERIPADRLLVSESGIHSSADVRMLHEAGVRAILVGEHLMAQADIGPAVCELMAI
jgi:indole-3-glycerol phosphate synthase